MGPASSNAPPVKRVALALKHAPSLPIGQPISVLQLVPEAIRLVVLMYVRFPLSQRNVEDLLSEGGIDMCHETVRMSWNWLLNLMQSSKNRQLDADQ